MSRDRQNKLLLAGSSLFAVGGLWMASNGKSDGWAAAAFFGLCAGVALWQLREAHNVARHAAVAAVRVLGYVPMRASLRTQLILPFAISLVGALWWGNVHGDRALYGALLGASGLGLTGMFLARAGKRAYLQFEVDGLRVGAPPSSYLVPWDDLAIAGRAEIQRWDVLLLAVRDASCMPEKVRAENAAMFGPGAQLALMPMQFGTDIALLSSALQRYVIRPECRTELARSDQLTG